MSEKHPECPLYNHANCREIHNPKLCAYSAQLGHQFRDYSAGHSILTRPPDQGKLSQLNRSEATIDFQYSLPLLSINQYKDPVTVN